ncbi:hypothetical protein SDC9_182897 [bioreactor metagenome]|uniref:Uncharacterized protein n=1 Tax=bioreactor metagenome TaxID=1076179 RepID=A0A645HB94_9ZZZZ
MGHTHHTVANAPVVVKVQAGGHDDRSQGDANAVTGVHPLHGTVMEVGSSKGVQTCVDGACAQPGEDAQKDHQTPDRDQRIRDQRQAGEGATGSQCAAHTQFVDDFATEEAGGHVTSGPGIHEQADGIKRDLEPGMHRRPGNTQQTVGQTQRNKCYKNQSDQTDLISRLFSLL